MLRKSDAYHKFYSMRSKTFRNTKERDMRIGVYVTHPCWKAATQNREQPKIDLTIAGTMIFGTTSHIMTTIASRMIFGRLLRAVGQCPSSHLDTHPLECNPRMLMLKHYKKKLHVG